MRGIIESMRTSGHFDDDVANRPDRKDIRYEWTKRGFQTPQYTELQSDGRTKHWVYVPEKARWLRVVILEDGCTVLTNCWDRGFPSKLDRWNHGLESNLKKESR